MKYDSSNIKFETISDSPIKVYKIKNGKRIYGKVADFQNFDNCWRSYYFNKDTKNGDVTYLGRFNTQDEALESILHMKEQSL